MHKECSFFLCIITNRRFEQPAVFCAEATIKKSDRLTKRSDLVLVGAGGFGPPKRNATDLQSAPFGHSGTRPYIIKNGAGGRTRTPDLLITNQLLYQLSYTSICSAAPSATNIL